MPMTNIVNVDETNFPFSVERTRTYADAGSRSVSEAGSNYSSRATAALPFSLAGVKVDHMLI